MHCFFIIFLEAARLKHNMRVFDVHLKQEEETTAALRRSTPPCACVTSLTLCVCVCVLMVHLGSVCRYSSPAHSFISPPAVTVGPRNVRCSKRCGGKCSLTHFCHLMWFVKNQLTYLVCFEDSTANHTHTHTLSLPLHRSFIHHSV